MRLFFISTSKRTSWNSISCVLVRSKCSVRAMDHVCQKMHWNEKDCLIEEVDKEDKDEILVRI